MSNRSLLLFLASSGWGGTEQIFVRLANGLSAQWNVRVLTPTGTKYEETFAPTVISETLREGSRRNPFVLTELGRLIDRVRPALIHTHAAKATEMVWWANQSRGLPHLATKHNTRSRRIFGRIRHVTAVSEQVRRSIDTPRPVHLVYNGVPGDGGRGSREYRGPLAGPAEPLRAVVIARLARHKGIRELIEAVATVATPIEVDVIGDGPERAELERLVETLGVRGRVRFLGFRSDAVDLLSEYDLQVIPSANEGFSLVLVEGLRRSAVVLSTPVGIAPEVLPDALVCRQSELSARIEDIALNYEDYAELFHASATKHVHRFTERGMVSAYASLYETILLEAAS